VDGNDILTIVSIALNLILGTICFLYILKPRNDGVMEVEELPDGGTIYSLNLDTDLDEISKKKRLVFKVNPS